MIISPEFVSEGSLEAGVEVRRKKITWSLCAIVHCSKKLLLAVPRGCSGFGYSFSVPCMSPQQQCALCGVWCSTPCNMVHVMLLCSFLFRGADVLELYFGCSPLFCPFWKRAQLLHTACRLLGNKRCPNSPNFEPGTVTSTTCHISSPFSSSPVESRCTQAIGPVTWHNLQCKL